MKVYVGTSGYAYNEWKGVFYPEKISSSKMLGFYSEHLNTVEINNTFYRMPTQSVLRSWAEQVPEDFRFTIKAPQLITHIKQLENVRDETEFLFGALSGLDNKLGAVLFQFSKSFRVDHSVLGNFLSLIPEDVSCSFAFRNPSMLNAETLALLSEHRCCLCIEDTDENPINKIADTASWGYLRLRRADYAEGDLLQRAKTIQAHNWDKAFVYFKHENEAGAPDMAMRLREFIESK